MIEDGDVSSAMWWPRLELTPAELRASRLKVPPSIYLVHIYLALSWILVFRGHVTYERGWKKACFHCNFHSIAIFKIGMLLIKSIFNLFNLNVNENMIILVLIFLVICYILSLPFLLLLFIRNHLLPLFRFSLKKKKKKISLRCMWTLFPTAVDFRCFRRGVWVSLCCFVCADECRPWPFPFFFLFFLFFPPSSASSCRDLCCVSREAARGELALRRITSPHMPLVSLNVSQSVKVLAKLPTRKLWITPSLPAALTEGRVWRVELWMDHHTERHTDPTAVRVLRQMHTGCQTLLFYSVPTRVNAVGTDV